MFEAHFQTFEDGGSPADSADRLARLRAELARRGVDGLVVPRADAHQNEYVPPGEERLKWLTGFSGSAGLAVVLPDKAAIFVDGRYTLQVGEQVDTRLFTPQHLVDAPPERWIEANLEGRRLGYDPWLHTAEQVDRLAKATKAAGGQLVPVSPNPIDAIWTDRPAAPAAPLRPHPTELAGDGTAAKLARIRHALADTRADALLVSDPHNIAWTFNVRGGDVAHTPLPLAWALVSRASTPPILFVDGRKLSNAVRDTLAADAEIAEPSELEGRLAALAGSGATVRVERSTAPQRLVELIEQAGGKVDAGADPIARLKACKNPVEVAGARAAHRRDGAAVVRFLAWLDREAPGGRLTEIDVVAALETFRRETGRLKDVAFPTIAGAGPNAALPHYRVTTRSNRRVEQGILLVDSGAQYVDGTTDITRTVAIGTPTPDMRRHFTLVLKGHLAIARMVFPEGTTGAQIDSFSRQHLWAAGLDFDHGTGHGVGSYLSVHEGPARISKLGTVALEAGMILSNEPGYYRPGAYGIRIENLELVVQAPSPEGAEKALLGFETLTLAPIDLNLVDTDLMTPDEISQLDVYHADVRTEIGPLVDAETRRWLDEATRPLRWGDGFL